MASRCFEFEYLLFAPATIWCPHSLVEGCDFPAVAARVRFPLRTSFCFCFGEARSPLLGHVRAATSGLMPCPCGAHRATRKRELASEGNAAHNS